MTFLAASLEWNYCRQCPQYHKRPVALLNEAEAGAHCIQASTSCNSAPGCAWHLGGNILTILQT